MDKWRKPVGESWSLDVWQISNRAQHRRTKIRRGPHTRSGMPELAYMRPWMCLELCVKGNCDLKHHLTDLTAQTASGHTWVLLRVVNDDPKFPFVILTFFNQILISNCHFNLINIINLYI